MSTTAKSTKKSTKITDQDNINDAAAAVQTKKPTKKSTKPKKDDEAAAAVSDSDKSFIENLGDAKVEDGDDIKTNTKPVINKKDQYIKKFESIKRGLTEMINKYTLNEFELNEEEKMTVLKSINDITIMTGIIHKSFDAFICGVSLDESETALPTNKAARKKKVVQLDEDGNVIKKDTSNSPINKKKDTHNEVLDFMGLDHGTQVSSAEVQTSIRQFMKKQKEADNENNVVGDLRTLLEFLIDKRNQEPVEKRAAEFKTKQDAKRRDHEKRKKEGKITTDFVETEFQPIETIPDKIDNTDIFKYAAYCFHGVSA